MLAQVAPNGHLIFKSYIRNRARLSMRRPSPKTLFQAGLVFLLLLQLLRLLDMGCDNTVCHRNGYVLGARLFMGSLVLGGFGWAFAQLLTGGNRPQPTFRLFTAIATGLTVVMTYVYLRSLFNQTITDIPIARPEVIALLLTMAGAAVLRSRHSYPAAKPNDETRDTRWMLNGALLLALCVVIAGRELPRDVLLSSDPDFHAFIGTQIERFGGVVSHQRDWGNQGFNYPAGSGVVQFVWHLVAGLDARDALVSMPLLFTYLGALVVAESLSSDLPRTTHRALISAAAVLLTAAGFLYPLYIEYAHMEGSARQMSIVFVALFMAFCFAWIKRSETQGIRALLLPAITVFILMTLNPANVVLPAIILLAMMVHDFILGRNRVPWQLPMVLLAATALALLDPYYHLLTGIAKQARIDTVVYADKLVIMDLPSIVQGTLSIWASNFGGFAHHATVLLAETKPPLFLILSALFALCAMAIGVRPRVSKALIGFWVCFVVALYLLFGFSLALENDRRFFLLSPYIFFSMSQFKAMMLVALAVIAWRTALQSKRGTFLTLGVAALMVLFTQFLVRKNQEIVLFPRQAYCGAFECTQLEDRLLLRKFEKMVKDGAFKNADEPTPKVLIANWISRSEIETWIFPVSGGRLYPHMNLLPAAFYYYQGDVDYSTHSYLEHVCERLDKPWLIAKGIRYIYLPTKRDKACVAGMEELIQTEEVILKEGNAYLIKFRSP